MIKLNERFEMKRDSRCWILYDQPPGLSKKGGKKKPVLSYHANFAQIAHRILQRSGDRCKNIDELRDLYANAETVLIDQLEEQIHPRVMGERENALEEKP